MKRLLTLILSITLILIVNTSVSTPTYGFTKPERDCRHLSIRKATEIFRHEDGSRSRWSEWRIVDKQTLRHAGPVVTGMIPRDFTGIVLPDEGRMQRSMEGKVQTASAFTIVCWPDSRSAHTKYPPKSCPASKKEAVQQFGGKESEWHLYYDSGDGYITWHYRSPKPRRIGAFTVPYQAYVKSWGYFYSTGYLFFPSALGKGTIFNLECLPR